MTLQLAFDIPPLAALRRADFFVSPANAAALAALDACDGWPEGKLLLIGPAGAGKSHLARIWADANKAEVIAAGDLAAADLPVLAQAGAVGVEDAETIGGQPAAEAALFHLHNLLRGAGRLLITAKAPPRDWGLCLPDLHSRMQAASLVQIAAPDDALLSAVLVKLFADRQVSVAPNLIAFLVQRMDRSIAAAQDLVAALDALSLARHRPVTRALAAEMLDSEAAQ